MITASRNKQHFLYVTFNDFPAIVEPAKEMQAKHRIKEAGYDFQAYGLTDIVKRETYSVSEFDGGQLTSTESIHCDPATLAGMALSLNRDDLAEELAEGFKVYQEAKATYDLEVQMYHEAASSRQGRPSQGRAARIQANVTPDLAQWLEAQKQAGDSISDVVFRMLDLLKHQESMKQQDQGVHGRRDRLAARAEPKGRKVETMKIVYEMKDGSEECVPCETIEDWQNEKSAAEMEVSSRGTLVSGYRMEYGSCEEETPAQ